MKVFVEEFFIQRYLESNIYLYFDRQDALMSACDRAINHMISLDCDDATLVDAELHKHYLNVMNSLNNKDYDTAITLYDEWCDELEDLDHIVRIYVYERPIIGNKPIDGTTMSNALSKLSDVPCKQCGRNVNASESVCWYCGVSSPANK